MENYYCAPKCYCHSIRDADFLKVTQLFILYYEKFYTKIDYLISLVLTHLSQMYFPIPINWPRFAASDLVLHCLPTSHKKDAMLIWVKIDINYPYINTSIRY